MRPIIYFILDGLGDRPIKELKWKTPLEAAKKPNIDKLATLGICGLINTIKHGIRPGSDVAHLALLGYDPEKYYFGRGPFEAVGYGLELKVGDIALRGNLGTIDNKSIIIDRRAGRIESSEPFAKLLNGLQINGVKIIAKAGLNHRLIIVLRGKNLSHKISDSDPHVVNEPILKIKPLDNSSQAKFTSDVVNKLIEYANEKFINHPININRIKQNQNSANCLLLRGAGQFINYPAFKERYGLSACCIAGAGLYKGIAKLLGMDIITIKGATGKADSNIKGKIDTALSLIGKYDFIFIHIKALDSLSEDGKPIQKRDFITKIDPHFKPLISLVKNRDVILSLTGDHTTSSELKIHTADEVPIFISGFGVRTDAVTVFGERGCQAGGLGHLNGANLMEYLFNLRGDTKLYGA